MFLPAGNIKVYLTLGSTDMRKSIDGLSLLVNERLELSPFRDTFLPFATENGIWLKSFIGTQTDFAFGIKG